MRMTIAPMTRHTGNAGHHRALRPDPRGRNAIDLPFTAAQAAALARVLDEIRTSLAHMENSGRFTALSGRTAGGVSVCHVAPPATPHASDLCPTALKTDNSGPAGMTSA